MYHLGSGSVAAYIREKIERKKEMDEDKTRLLLLAVEC